MKIINHRITASYGHDRGLVLGDERQLGVEDLLVELRGAGKVNREQRQQSRRDLWRWS